MNIKKVKIPKMNSDNAVFKKIAVFFKVIGSAFKIAAKKTVAFFSLPKTRKVLVWVAAVFFVIITVFAVMIYGFQKDDKVTRLVARIVPYPVAMVNQNTITYSRYLEEKDYIHHFYEKTQQEDIDSHALDKEIMQLLVENNLIAQQAKINHISINKSDVENSLNDVVEQNGGEEKVAKVLNDLYGIDIDQFKDLIKTQMLREKVDSELIAKVTVSHILINVDSAATQETIDAAKAKIDGIKKEIDNGLDFAEAAKKYSEDTGSAENGGKLDAFAAGEMVTEFSNAAFSTEVGKISDPVKTDFGWHIIKVESKTGKIQKSFTDWLTSVQNSSLVIHFYKI